MALSTTLSIFILTLLVLCSFSYAQNPKVFIFPIKKHGPTNQYYTTIQIGSNSTKFSVALDLGGKFLWFNSAAYFSAAAWYSPILCGTQQCRIANGYGCTSCSDSPPVVPGCANNACSDYGLNPFTGRQWYGGLGLDVLHVHSARGVRYNLKRLSFQYTDTGHIEGLPGPTLGVIGLGRTRIALQAQLSTSFTIRQKFALCLPSSRKGGNLIIGEGIYKNPFQEISKSLMTTPLKRNPVTTRGDDQIGDLKAEYFIDVKSIRVGTKTLSFNNTLLPIDKKTGDGGTALRTVRPYTVLHTSIYTALVDEFVKAAASKRIARVASVAPFGACFDAKTIASGKTGPEVPIIELVLQNKNVYWRFYGSNSMVRVSNDVICLAFVERPDTFAEKITSIAIGGHQMENYLFEFDVESKRLGFSSSLMLHDTSCSQFGAN